MGIPHTIEVFTEGCPSCEGAVVHAHELAASSDGYEVRVCDVTQAEARARAHGLGITELPAIAIDGEPLVCCGGHPEGSTGA